MDLFSGLLRTRELTVEPPAQIAMDDALSLNGAGGVESNSQPRIYRNLALPLSYTGERPAE